MRSRYNSRGYHSYHVRPSYYDRYTVQTPYTPSYRPPTYRVTRFVTRYQVPRLPRKAWEPAPHQAPFRYNLSKRENLSTRYPLRMLKKIRGMAANSLTGAISSLAGTPTHPLRQALVCARRKARKEVLLALGLGGSGGGKPKRTSTYKVRC